MEAGARGAEGALGGGEGGVCERVCRGAKRRAQGEARKGEAGRRGEVAVARWVAGCVEADGGGAHPEGRPGVRPAETPDIAEAAAELAAFLKRTFAYLLPAFGDVYGDRDESKCLYMNDTVTCTFLAVTMLRCRSRNGADGCRNSEAMASSMLDLSGQSWWPRGEKVTTACTETLVYRMRGWAVEKLKVVNAKLVRHLINAKFFENDRFQGCYFIAVDAVHRDERRNGVGEDRAKREKKTIALEAKLITRTGMAITVCTEDVEPYDDQRLKQDCEINAFKRMAPDLRKLFRKYPLCLVGDALYGCDSVWKTCEEFGWKYITTFKEGRMPDVYASVKLLFDANVCERGELLKGDAKARFGEMKWVLGVRTNASDGYRINVIWGRISFLEDVGRRGRQKKPYEGMFATNFRIGDLSDADAVFCWGRRRWNIENVFKEQKHGGFGLKHRFVNATNANRVWYLMMQIAWTLWQMFQRGFLLRLETGCRKMTQVLWAEELRTFLRHFGCVGLVPRYRLLCRKNI